MKKLMGILAAAVLCVVPGSMIMAEEVTNEPTALYVEQQAEAQQSSVKPGAVAGLIAQASGRQTVKLSWQKTDGAQIYIIYRRIGNGKFEYLYMTSNLNWTDTKASGIEYNFYRVYAGYYGTDGKLRFGEAGNYVYAKPTLPKTQGMKAEEAGKNKVKLTWNKVNGADGYIIYRKVGSGKAAYLAQTTNLSFTDVRASDEEYNFYWVYPYYMENGRRVMGSSGAYVYAKGVLTPVSGLKASSSGKNIKITWNQLSGADGYLIYRRIGSGSFEYRYMKGASDTSFVDTKGSGTEYNFYRVYPYYNKNGKRIVGKSGSYVYGKVQVAPMEEFEAVQSGQKEVTITWQTRNNVDGYYVCRSQNGEAWRDNHIADVGKDCGQYVDRTAEENITYIYSVIPYVIDGENVTITPSSSTGHYVNVAAIGQTRDVYVTGTECYDYAYQVLDLVNQERMKTGAAPLKMDADLMKAAMQRAAEITVSFSHTRPSGLDCYSASGKMSGENIAMGYVSPEAVMDGWMNSDGHRANILNSGYTDIGIGAFCVDGTYYWVQCFGRDQEMYVQADHPADRVVTAVVKQKIE